MDEDNKKAWRKDFESKIQIALNEHFYFTDEEVHVSITYIDEEEEGDKED